MPLTPEQEKFANDYKKSFWRWRENQDADDMITVLARLVSKETLNAIINDLDSYFTAAEEERTTEFETSIRKHAESLPDGNPLKNAIDGVSKKP